MSKTEVKRFVMHELSSWWIRSGYVMTITPAELAADQRVPMKLAKAALKDLRQAGNLQKCSGCGCYSLADELLR